MKTQPHYKQLDCQERETIALGVETGLSMRAIARMLGRPPSAISREIDRNSGGGVRPNGFVVTAFIDGEKTVRRFTQ